MVTQPSAVVLMNSMLQRAPSKKAVWSIKPVRTQGKRPTKDRLAENHMIYTLKGSVAVGTGTQWQLAQPLLVVQQECVSKPCSAAATMERRPHQLFLRLKDEGEDKQRSLEMVRDGEMINHFHNIFKVRLKPLVMKQPTTTMELQEKAKRTAMALEMLQRKKKEERMRPSARRTRSARTGNSVNGMLEFLCLNTYQGVVRTGAHIPRDRKSKAALSVLR